MNTPNAQILVFNHYFHQVESWVLEEITNTKAGPGKKKGKMNPESIESSKKREISKGHRRPFEGTPTV